MPDAITNPVVIDCFELEETASPQDLAVANHLLAVLLLRLAMNPPAAPPEAGIKPPTSRG